jgi:5-methylcytosine-specific restriction endonuclease McrA
MITAPAEDADSVGDPTQAPERRAAPASHMPSFVRQPSGLRHYPALVLNADYRPLSYLPLSLWPWQEAIKAAFLDRVIVLAEYDAVVRSPSVEIPLPSVVVLKDYVRPAKSAAFTRFNLFLRDEFTCQYCGSREALTFDHVTPRVRGGRTTWSNVVAACGPCNLRKGSRTLKQAGMNLRRPPLRPTPERLQNIGRKFPPNHLHGSWMDYLYWDAELEA